MSVAKPRVGSLWAARRLGGAIGASSAPGAMYAAHWSGLGPASWYVWVIAIGVAALLGALTWPVFIVDEADRAQPSRGFGAVFGCTVGMLAGMLVAFPMGGVFGMASGAVAGAVATSLWRLAGLQRKGSAIASGAAAVGGGLLGLAVIAGWLA